MSRPPLALIVDDNPLNLELARHVLEADGFVVAVAPDADEALAALARQWPDVALIDIQLPGTDGLSLVRRIRGLPGGADLPLIAFTAYAMQGDAQRFQAAGCDGYLSKPIDVRRFAAQVRQHLRAGAAGGGT